MAKDKKSFFERLTGTIKIEDDQDEDEETSVAYKMPAARGGAVKEQQDWLQEDQPEGELTVDVYQTPTHVIVKSIVAGVKPEDLDISISRDMVTVKGSRQEVKEVSDADYFHKELYWGSFSRTIMLPEEVDVEDSEASARDGLLIIKMPKINKQKQTKLRVRTS